jgi:predicted amidophosphoribosyltransferase
MHKLKESAMLMDEALNNSTLPLACPLCQTEIPPDAESCHAECPLARHCGLIRCPNCGYEMPRESKLVSLIRRWIGKT